VPLSAAPVLGAESYINIATEACIVTRTADGTTRSPAQKIAACTQWLALADDPVSPLYYRAMVLEEAGQLDAALADYTAVIEAGANLPRSYASRARITASQGGDVDAAIADMDRAIALTQGTDRVRPSYFLTRAIMLSHKAHQAAGSVRLRWLDAARVDLETFKHLAKGRKGKAAVNQRVMAGKLLAWIKEQA